MLDEVKGIKQMDEDSGFDDIDWALTLPVAGGWR